MIEDEYEPEVEAIAKASAAFDGRRFDDLTEFVKRIYLDRAKYSLEAMRLVEDAEDRQQVRKRLTAKFMLEGKAR